jgi:hypothetical protein
MSNELKEKRRFNGGGRKGSMISGKIAERRWLKEPTQLQWRVTLLSTKISQLSPIKRVGYLSLKRKNPVIEEHKIPNKTQPVHPCETPPSCHLYTSNISLKLLSIVAIPIAPIQPTATTMNHFCLSFITKI